jgi:hypothetical protein
MKDQKKNILISITILKILIVYITVSSIYLILSQHTPRIAAFLNIGGGIFLLFLLCCIFILLFIIDGISSGSNFCRWAVMILIILDLIDSIFLFHNHWNNLLYPTYLLEIIQSFFGLLALLFLFLPSSNRHFKKNNEKDK